MQNSSQHVAVRNTSDVTTRSNVSSGAATQCLRRLLGAARIMCGPEKLLGVAGFDERNHDTGTRTVGSGNHALALQRLFEVVHLERHMRNRFHQLRIQSYGSLRTRSGAAGFDADEQSRKR